jgi:hypothetical protein
MSLEKYKNDIGDYPPDGLNRNATQQHISSYYRRVNMPQTGINATASPPFLPQFDTVNVPQANQRVDPSEALVFWLALVGKNKQNPFPSPFPVGPNGTKLETALQYLQSDLGVRRFEFQPGRLTDYDQDGWPEYCPEFSDLSPYVYYHHDTYDLDFTKGAPFDLPAYAHPQGNGIARPYLATPTSGTTPTQYMAPRKYQIISTGLDGFYSNATEVVGTDVFKTYPDGSNYTLEDEDNITSFSEGKSLGDKRP